MWVAETTYFLSLILAFTFINSELRNISSDKVTLKCLIIMYLWCHLSLVTFAFTLSMLQFAPCLWVEFLRDRLGFLSYENGYLPRCNLTHNRVPRLVVA